jgi:hypothetical protein
MTGNGSSFPHLMDQIDARLERIERAVDRLADQSAYRYDRIDGRMSDMERTHSEVRGGWKALTIIGSIGATAAGALGGYLGRLF